MNDVFICDAIRTPVGKYGGSLSAIRADDLAAIPIKTLLERNYQIDPAAFDDVLMGCANQAGEDNRNIARMALLLAGMPESVPGVTINRLCSSGMEAIGLAARDSLRLEMGYCLYGHDIDAATSPIEAALAWVIGKENTGFIGAETVLEHMHNGVARKRVGVHLLDKGIAREGAPIFDGQGLEIGTLTSGGYGPSVEAAVGQGYVPVEYAKTGTDIFVDVRGRKIAAKVARMPFREAQTKAN